MSETKNPLNLFFYLAPAWFLLETFFWPGFRAGIITGGDAWGNAAFYSMEAAIGAALWFDLKHAGKAALAENAAYLLFALKFVLITPLDIAATLGDDAVKAAGTAFTYKAAMPGILYSAARVGLSLSLSLRKFKP